MASPPILTPSGTTGYNILVTKREIAGATYQRALIAQKFDDVGRPLGGMTLRKHARMFGTTLIQSADGTGLTPSNMSGTPVTMTPAGSYIMVQWSENEAAQIDANLNTEARGELYQAMAEAIDSGIAANFASFTQSISVASIDGPTWRQVAARVMTNTNGKYGPDNGLFAIFSTTQAPNFGNIDEYNNAEVRGDSENPYVKGFFVKAGGIMLYFTTVITQDGNGWHNFVGTKDAIAIGWNRHTELRDQEFELTNKMIAYANLGSTIYHDLRGYDVRTTASGL